MILMSQAYVLRRIWGIKTNNKFYLKNLLKHWMSHRFIKNNFKIFLHEHAIVNHLELLNFRKKDWTRWLKCINRYNLPFKIWYRIKPEQWRFRVTKHWQIGKVKTFSTEKSKDFSICDQEKKFSIYIFFNSSLTLIKKRNKLVKNAFSAYSYLDLTKNSLNKKFSKLKEKDIFKDNNNNKIYKISSISKKINFPYLSISEKSKFLEYNLLLWFIPELVIEEKNVYRSEKILSKHREILRNKDLLREKELNQSTRQWRWKSKNSEKNFEKLGNMASLMTFMQNEETIISLSGKMREDLDSFRLFFRRNSSLNRLTINSEHRLARFMNDQILIYKLISTYSIFKKRLQKMSNSENVDKFVLNIYKNKQRKNLYFFNLEDILLPKYRREFRILNSLSLQEKDKIKLKVNIGKEIKKRNKKIETNRNQLVKNFIWSRYRFEDLACINRFWFSTINGSRFSMLRLRLYPVI